MAPDDLTNWCDRFFQVMSIISLNLRNSGLPY
jgi:hypothetical protein